MVVLHSFILVFICSSLTLCSGMLLIVWCWLHALYNSVWQYVYRGGCWLVDCDLTGQFLVPSTSSLDVVYLQLDGPMLYIHLCSMTATNSHFSYIPYLQASFDPLYGQITKHIRPELLFSPALLAFFGCIVFIIMNFMYTMNL